MLNNVIISIIMKYKFILACLSIGAIAFIVDFTSYASPYGMGIYNASVPYGSQTSLSISAQTNVGLSLNPAASGTLATSTGTVTVYSTDVVGFRLYVRSIGSTNLLQGAQTIAASANVTPASLAVNTWGFNIDASANFRGVQLTDILLKDMTGPYASGDVTTVTYGLYLDRSKPAGSYSTNVMYSAVPETP